jgi:hypothetical protein
MLQCIASNTIENGEHSIRVYPNPAHQNIHVDVLNVPVKIEIINSQGHCVFRKVISSSEAIDISDVSSGVYYLRCSNDRMIKVEKIVISR